MYVMPWIITLPVRKQKCYFIDSYLSMATSVALIPLHREQKSECCQSSLSMSSKKMQPLMVRMLIEGKQERLASLNTAGPISSIMQLFYFVETKPWQPAAMLKGIVKWILTSLQNSDFPLVCGLLLLTLGTILIIENSVLS